MYPFPMVLMVVGIGLVTGTTVHFILLWIVRGIGRVLDSVDEYQQMMDDWRKTKR